MLTFSFALLFCVLLIGFYRINRLPVTKIIPLWLFIVLISGLTFNSIFTNLGYIDKPMTADRYVTYHVLHKLISPIGAILSINIYHSLKVPLKWGWLILGTVIFMTGERIVEQIGIIKYVDWNIEYSALMWFSFIILSLIFEHLLERGGDHL
ncbi:hypothetical protein [Robertmurraya kyonggiensis]|uniref:Uncharacterized protein n=1 Tax=Robertmurraya kyonggiensis TaxID=1037680 RepID=A0A4U1D4L2_9BACI|nr:hypothetical protein [Robertmurraya kyonggiensis]TKC16798.1 hypothetical protein FA727_12070 [Robertmurraya kyonggiensis]